MDRERVSLSLKATQEDPWQHFARTHQIGQIVPGKVTKLVPFGSFVRVEEGIEGLVHISELAERHVEIPEQVVQVNDDVMVKIIDIDLERRRISLSLKQANETTAATDVEEFDPTLYGMAATYDEQGNYIYPEASTPRRASGSRATTSSARPGRTSTPRRTPAGRPTSSSRRRPSRPRSRPARPRRTPPRRGGTTDEVETGEESGGSLASDEALQALREKLTGGELTASADSHRPRRARPRGRALRRSGSLSGCDPHRLSGTMCACCSRSTPPGQPWSRAGPWATTSSGPGAPSRVTPFLRTSSWAGPRPMTSRPTSSPRPTASPGRVRRALARRRGGRGGAGPASRRARAPRPGARSRAVRELVAHGRSTHPELPDVILRVRPENAQAIRAYVAAGFVDVPADEQATWNEGQRFAYHWMVIPA